MYCLKFVPNAGPPDSQFTRPVQPSYCHQGPVVCGVRSVASRFIIANRGLSPVGARVDPGANMHRAREHAGEKYRGPMARGEGRGTRTVRSVKTGIVCGRWPVLEGRLRTGSPEPTGTQRMGSATAAAAPGRGWRWEAGITTDDTVRAGWERWAHCLLYK